MNIRRHRLDLNLLISLRELLAEKSVTRAGAAMHVTQSSMSGILARLRDYFDDPLIVPVGRKMELTPLAKSLVDPVNDLLMRIDATLKTRPNFNPATSQRHFTIIASDYVISVLLLDVLRSVHREAKGIKIELIQTSENAADKLEEGEVDFIIAPQYLSSDKHSSIAMFEDSYRVVVDKNNTQVGDKITLEQYFSFGHAMFRSHGAAMFENWFAEHHGDKRQVEVVTQTFNLLPHLVVDTERLATMHMRLAQQYMTMLPIRLVEPLFNIPRLVEVLQWHNNSNIDPGSIWLRNKIIETSRALPPIFSNL